MIGEKTIWFDAGLRTPFVGVDGPFAHRESLALSMPVVQAMAPLAVGQIDFAVWLPAWRRTRAGLPPVAIVGNYVGTGSNVRAGFIDAPEIGLPQRPASAM